ncbi:metallophosphoesterase family protein [Priestia koreensis]|uniref:metallophosphoesterase family protein n=1 Tax=Priestia koreensis TaxID=284581 RepID=UPI0028F70AE9|nr:metallophosphoesterase family protein [Priestia koreensis]
MKHKIALLADVHGNMSALKSVLNDCKKENVTEYWFLGDLLMPGPGTNDLFQLLESVNTTLYVKGNWEDCFLEVLQKDIDLDHETDVYIARLTQFQCENLNEAYIEKIKCLPMHQVENRNALSISISHHLPQKNYGRDLSPDNDQQQFDQLFDQSYDIAIYAHTHHQLLRYSSNDQLIINPGTVGQPFYKWDKFQSDRRAQYAILEIDDAGVADVHFKRVSYDIETELVHASTQQLPYLNLYTEMLQTGKTSTHEHQVLQGVNQQFHYKEDIIQFFSERYWPKVEKS